MPFRDIWWIATPLALFRGDGYQPLFLENYDSLSKVYHWALEVDGRTYEVTPNEEVVEGWERFTQLCKPKRPFRNALEWRKEHEGFIVKPKKVGQTKRTHDEIDQKITDIWTQYNNNKYLPLTQNCQNFVKLLYQEIVIPQNDVSIDETERKTWEKFPSPVSYRLAELSQGLLVGTASYGLYYSYLAALTTVMETGQAGLLAAGVAAETIEGVAVTSAAATTEGTTGAAGGVAAAGGGGGGSQAAGAGAASTTSQSASTTTALGGGKTTTIGAAKGTAASGTSGATHVGLGAKASAVLHGASATKAAAVGGTMLKSAGAFAIVHPFAGAAVAGTGVGLMWLGTTGKRDKYWGRSSKKKRKAEEEVEEEVKEEVEKRMKKPCTAKEMFEMEAKLFMHQQQTDEGKVSEEIAGDLDLTLVTTEPAGLGEEEVRENGEVLPAEDPQRAQTLP